MDKFLTALQNYGCRDLDVTMERFMQDEEFYYEILQQVVSDPGFEKLGEQLKAGDVKAAFDSAHSLKGIISNCGITPMTNLIVAITEPLRVGDSEGLEGYYDSLLQRRREFADMLGKLQPNV